MKRSTNKLKEEREKAMKQIIVDIQKKEKDWESVVGEIHITDDLNGRFYIETGEISFGINLPDLMDFIMEEMLRDAP